jgi:hypothetical protein
LPIDVRPDDSLVFDCLQAMRRPSSDTGKSAAKSIVVRRVQPLRIACRNAPTSRPCTQASGQSRPGGRWRRCLAVGVVLGILATSPRAATVTIEAQREDGAIELRASVLLAADAQTAWRVLTDYGRYPEFIPDLRTSRVVARHGTSVTVEQSGDARVWLLRLPLDITFAILENPPNRLRSRATAGSLRALESSYELRTVAGGVRLDYAGHVVPGYRLAGVFEQLAVENNVARQLQALADEIERESAKAKAPAGAPTGR